MSVLVSLQIPLPPLPEQQRIVVALTEQIAAVEQAKAAVTKQLAAAQALPAAYLRAVFDSPAAQDWTQVRLGDVAITLQNGIYKSAENYGKGKPFIRMYNIQNTSWNLDLGKMAAVVVSERELEQFALCEGDLLISRVNSVEMVGKCAWVNSKAKGFVFENMLIRIRLASTINSLFVAQQMSTRNVRQQIQNVTKRAIGQASINSADLRSIKIALPSLENQNRIAQSLNEKIANSTKLCQVLETQLTAFNTIPATLLRRAFAGELVPQQAVVPVPKRVWSMVERATAVGAYIVNRLHPQSWLGRVKFAKFQYLTEAWVGVVLGGHYQRASYGPYDPNLGQLEGIAEQYGWFTVHPHPDPQKNRYDYKLGSATAAAVEIATSVLGEQQPALDTLLSLLGSLDTKQVEKIATLFAVWNDFLLDGHRPTDNAIITEFRTHWRESKAHFSPETLQHDLNWMREHGLIPHGIGPHTESRYAPHLES